MPHSTRLYTAGQGNAAAQDRRVALNVQGANNASLPAKQTILTTAETVINDPVLAGASALVLQIPPGGPCEQEVFDVVASGIVVIGTSSTMTIAVRQGTTISATKIATSGASASLTGPGTYNWNFRLRLEYDSVSFTLTGTMQFIINGVVTQAEVALTANGTLVADSFGNKGNTANPVVQFLITVTFGTGGTQVFTVKDFGVNH